MFVGAGMAFSFSGLKTQVRQTILRENKAAAQGRSAPAPPALEPVTLPGLPAFTPNARVAEGHFLSAATKRNIAASFQRAALAHVARRTRRALQWAKQGAVGAQSPGCAEAKSVVLCGGVAANKALRSLLAETCASEGFALVVPPHEHCADNGVMIAHAGLLKHRAGVAHSLDIGYDPRWRIDASHVPPSKRA